MAHSPVSTSRWAALLLLGLAFVLLADATQARRKRDPEPIRFTSTVDSIADPTFPLAGKRYFFESSMANIGTEDLEFREVARWLSHALGHPVAASREDADVLVRVAFGIGSPQTTRSTVVTAPGYSYPIGMYWYSAPPLTETYVNTTYTRQLNVEAYDLKTPGRLPQVWKTSITSVGSRGDLRYVLPFMIAMGGDYFQKNAGHLEIQIPDDATGRAVVDSWIGPPPSAAVAAPAAPATAPAPEAPATPTVVPATPEPAAAPEPIATPVPPATPTTTPTTPAPASTETPKPPEKTVPTP